MNQVRMNILSEESLQWFDAVCFTSNGVVKRNGALVMGAGIARAFRDRFHRLDAMAGLKVQAEGNVCQVIIPGELRGSAAIVAFPTKHHWRNPSSPKLIKQSALQLVDLTEFHGWQKVALPRPGCGMGGLEWASVKAMLDPIFDERITICSL